MFGIKLKAMKCRFEVTIRDKFVMIGIKPKLMKCMFELTYLYDLFQDHYSEGSHAWHKAEAYEVYV
jgi:hypothetical protein